MGSFLLIRHAESPWSEDDMRPLSPAGMRAAEALPAQLHGLRMNAIYSSPYRRAVQTIEPLARHRRMAIAQVPELRERALGAIGDASFMDAVAATWNDFDLIHPGGESNRVAQERVVGLVGELARRHASQTIVLATHGNLLALLLNAFDPSIDFTFWRGLTLPDVFELRLLSPSEGVVRRVITEVV
ncbi:MAG: histidine phosphatase family protein [Planctomycetota bacterium]